MTSDGRNAPPAATSPARQAFLEGRCCVERPYRLPSAWPNDAPKGCGVSTPVVLMGAPL